MTFTKPQLEAMQDAGVPIEGHAFGCWEANGPYGFRDPPEHYRPQPGYTFGGDVAKKLKAAVVALEWTIHHEAWYPGDCLDDVHRFGDPMYTWRIADNQPAPDQPTREATGDKETCIVVEELDDGLYLIGDEHEPMKFDSADAHARGLAQQRGGKFVVFKAVSAWQRTEPKVERVEI